MLRLHWRDDSSFKKLRAFQQIGQATNREAYGFDFSTQLFYNSIISVVKKLRWTTFCGQFAQPTVISIIQEFYVNFSKAKEQKVSMRDVLMDISPTAIETFHKTPHYESSFYDTLNEDEMDYNEIIEFLIDGPSSWVQKLVTREPICFKQSIMFLIAKIWMYFIYTKLFLTQHVTKVTRDRAFLLYAILQQESINVGDQI